MLNQMMNSGGNPQAMLNQIIGKSNPEQIQSVLQQAKQVGVPDNILSQLQNMQK